MIKIAIPLLSGAGSATICRRRQPVPWPSASTFISSTQVRVEW